MRERERESERVRERGECMYVQCGYVCFVPQESGDKMEAIYNTVH